MVKNVNLHRLVQPTAGFKESIGKSGWYRPRFVKLTKSQKKISCLSDLPINLTNCLLFFTTYLVIWLYNVFMSRP